MLPDLRGRLVHALFLQVAGPDGPRQRERIHYREGPRWFEAGSPITRVHARVTSPSPDQSVSWTFAAAVTLAFPRFPPWFQDGKEGVDGSSPSEGLTV